MKRFILTFWFLYVVLFFVAVCVGNRGHVPFLYLAFCIGVAEVVFCNITDNFCFSLFLVPNIRILDDIGISFAVNILMVLPFAKYILVTRKIQPRILVYAIAFGMMEFAHDMAYDKWEEFFPMLCWLLSFMYCMSVFLNRSIKLALSDLYYAFFYGIGVSSFAYLLSHGEYASDLLRKTMIGYRFEAYGNDPNYFSMYICMTLALLFALPRKNLLHQGMLLGLIFLGLLTGSKMCLLLMTFILLYVFFTQGLKRSKEAKFIRYSAVWLLLGAVAVSKQLIIFVNNFAKRAGLNNISMELDALTTGRSTLMYDYINYFFSDCGTLLFGCGMSYNIIIGIHYHGAHNTYLDIALAWGILGIIILGVALYNLTRMAQLTWKKSLLYYLPLMCVLLNFMDLSCFSSTMFWFVVIAALFPLRAYLTEEKGNAQRIL